MTILPVFFIHPFKSSFKLHECSCLLHVVKFVDVLRIAIKRFAIGTNRPHTITTLDREVMLVWPVLAIRVYGLVLRTDLHRHQIPATSADTMLPSQVHTSPVSQGQRLNHLEVG